MTERVLVRPCWGGEPGTCHHYAMASIGLVLGAGGLAGHAYEAGVLAALAERTGWDPNNANIVVGTSAGAGVAAYIRSGLSAADLYRRAPGAAVSPAGSLLFARIGR